VNGAEPVRLVAAHREAVGFYRYHLLTDDTARLYLARRGLAALALPDLPWHPAVDKPWQVGYAPPGWRHLTDHLIRLGYTDDELIAAGLARRASSGRVYDTFRDRIMFPIRNAANEVVAFTGRALRPHERTPKYLNTAETSIFHKRQTWYGLAEQADRLAAGAPPVIVEGPLDVIAVWLAHPDNAGLPRAALAACGTNLSADHIASLTALPGAARHGITTCYDPDPAGAAATERAWQHLHRSDVPLRAAGLPDGADPADLLTVPGGHAVLREALSHRARPMLDTLIDQRLDGFFDRYADRPDSIELRVAAVHAVTDLLTHAPPDRANSLVEHVAEVTGTDVETVVNAVIAAYDRDDGTPAPNLAGLRSFANLGTLPTPSAEAPRPAMKPAHTPTMRPRRASRY
jgi:DNA primase